MWQEAGRGGEKMKRKQVTLASRKEQVTNNPKKKSKHTFRVSAQDFAVSGKYTSARGRVGGGGRRARWLVAHSNIQVR
jgi:translation elongation factor EF-Tu-like GTPase